MAEGTKNLKTLLIEKSSDILVIRLNRPKVLNAVTSTMREELDIALGSVNDDQSVQGVVITGSGIKAFCAGQDLEEASTFGLGDADEWMEQTRRMFSAVRNIDKPCIAAVNGIAAGAGLQIALLCDLRIGTATTRMAQPEIKAGLGSVLGSYLLSLYFGHARSIELSLTARYVDAKECLQIGLLNKLVDSSNVLETAIEEGNRLAQQPKKAFKLTKERYREVTQQGFEDAFSAAGRFVSEAYKTGEPQTIMANFLKGRKNG